MAFSRRIVTLSTLLVAIAGVTGCDALKKVKDACSVTVAPRDLQVPVNASQQILGTAFDCDGNSILNKKINFKSANDAIATVTSNGVVLGVSVGTTTVSATANGKSGDATVVITPERVGTIAITPATVTLRRTNTRVLTAAAKNSQGVVIPGITFQWASSNSSLASVNNAGSVTALAPGQVTISATADGQAGTSLITITEVPIGVCELNPKTQKITVGGQASPSLILKDTAGGVLSPVGRSITWTSDNNLVATVTGSGVVSGVKAGTARITAADQTNPATNCDVTVEVVLPRIVSVAINPIGANLRLGAQRQYTLTLFDSNSVAISQVGRTIVWKNPTPTYANVGTNGLVNPVAITPAGLVGRVGVDAEGVTDEVTYTVTKIPVVKVEVSPPQRIVVEGATAQFSAIVTDSANNVVTDRPIDWTSSDITRAQISTAGLASTFAPGQVTITAIVEGRTATGTLIITQVPVDTILLQTATQTVTRGTTTAISIDLRDASNRQLRNRTVIVTSDQPGIAVGSANTAATQVTVQGIAVGSATLTIQAVNSNNQNEGKPSKVVITVTPP